MTKPTYKTYTYMVEPGQTEVVHRAASFLICLDASGPFKIMFDDGAESDFEHGLTFRGEFERVHMINTSTETLVVKIGMGRGDIRDSRFVLPGQVETRETPPNDFRTGDPVACPDSQATVVAAVNSQRGEVLLVNTSGTGKVSVCGNVGATAGQGIPLLPMQSMTLKATAAIVVRNDSGAAVNVAVAELEWSA